MAAKFGVPPLPSSPKAARAHLAKAPSDGASKRSLTTSAPASVPGPITSSEVVDDVLIHNSILLKHILALRESLAAVPLPGPASTAVNNLNASNGAEGALAALPQSPEAVALRALVAEQLRGLEDLQNIAESQKRSIERDYSLMEKHFVEMNKLRQEVKSFRGRSDNKKETAKGSDSKTSKSNSAFEDFSLFDKVAAFFTMDVDISLKGSIISAKSRARLLPVEKASSSPMSPRLKKSAEANRRGVPLSKDQWEKAFDPQGRLVDPGAIKKIIFNGGVEKSIRSEVWKYLLEFYPWNSTATERLNVYNGKRKLYQELKRAWASLSPADEELYDRFQTDCYQIRLDVNRTYRDHPLFAKDSSDYLQKLRDILYTYSYFNPGLEYSQGMNDLGAVLLLALGDEVDAFWCFKGLMDFREPYFDRNKMMEQLLKLERLIKRLDRFLYDHLEKHDALNLFFTYRWLLLSFRREFDNEDIMRLWEVLWTKSNHEEFELFFALAILMKHQGTIVEQDMDFDHLLMYVNELSRQIDLNEHLQLAEALLASFVSLPLEIQLEVFPPPPKFEDKLRQTSGNLLSSTPPTSSPLSGSTDSVSGSASS